MIWYCPQWITCHQDRTLRRRQLGDVFVKIVSHVFQCPLSDQVGEDHVIQVRQPLKGLLVQHAQFPPFCVVCFCQRRNHLLRLKGVQRK